MSSSSAGDEGLKGDVARRARSFRVAGSLLRSLRVARGWTQEQAAERIGLSDRLIRKAEAGEPIELQSITMLAQLYSTPEAPLGSKELLAAPLRADGGESAQAIQTEAIVCRWFEEFWNQRRLDVIEELAASDCVLRAEGVEFRGHAEIRRRGEVIQAAFSDVEFVVQQMLSAADMVMSRWRMAATHGGPWMGEPATGERVIMYGASWIRLEGGLLREGWDYWEPRQP